MTLDSKKAWDSALATASGRLFHSGMVRGNLGSWFLKPSQPQRIISGLRETFIQRYIVERTSKAGKDRKDRVRKRKSCWENLLNEIQLKGPKRQKQTQEQNKKELVYVKA